MTTLTITAKGQITLKREVLEHLGLQPGSRVEVDLLPNGKVGLMPVHAAASTSWDDYWASLPRYDGPTITLEQMDEAVAAHVGEDDERIMREARSRRGGERGSV